MTCGPFCGKLVENAVDIALEDEIDLEDVLQCLCVKDNGCTVMVTNDKKFYDCGLSICTVYNFLNEHKIA